MSDIITNKEELEAFIKARNLVAKDAELVRGMYERLHKKQVHDALNAQPIKPPPGGYKP